MAARVAGLDEAIRLRNDENVRITAPLLYGLIDPLLAVELSGDERTRLAAEGAAMRDEEAFKLAFGDAEQAT